MQSRNTAAALDFDQLKNITMGDTELMREIISALIDDTSVQIGKIRHAAEQANAAECVRLAHFVKGACANVGAAPLAGVLTSIERLAADGNWESCRKSVSNLDGEFERLRVQAASFLVAPQAA